ncbi:hypothetical protein Tco_0532275 [Tanacetum coccineum]
MSAKSLYFVGGKIVAAIDFVKELRVDNQHIKVINLGINLKDDKSELSILVDRSIGAPHVGDRSIMVKKAVLTNLFWYEVPDGCDLVHAGAEPVAYGSCVGAGGGVGLAAVQIGKEQEKETKKGSKSGSYSQKVVSGNKGGWDSKKLVMIPREGSGIRAPSRVKRWSSLANYLYLKLLKILQMHLNGIKERNVLKGEQAGPWTSWAKKDDKKDQSASQMEDSSNTNLDGSIVRSLLSFFTSNLCTGNCLMF